MEKGFSRIKDASEIRVEAGDSVDEMLRVKKFQYEIYSWLRGELCVLCGIELP